jgi:hypothetical protein
VEVTFTVSPRVRPIAGHDPHKLPIWEYCRQVLWSSGVDLPDDYEQLIEEITLDSLELPAGEKAILSLQLPAEFLIVFDPVTHATQFLDVKGEPTRERQALALMFDNVKAPTGKSELRPGPLRISLENRAEVRVLPAIWIAGEKLHELLGRRRPFLTAKRLLTNQTFRDVYRANTLDVDQRLKITSLTFLFTDLKGSTELYERVGDLAAFDLVRAHFRELHEIVATEAGAVVKTIGDAVMATFPPLTGRGGRRCACARPCAASTRARRRGPALKIGIRPLPGRHLERPTGLFRADREHRLARRTLAVSRAIFATESVVDNPQSSKLLATVGLKGCPSARASTGSAPASPLRNPLRIAPFGESRRDHLISTSSQKLTQ